MHASSSKSTVYSYLIMELVMPSILLCTLNEEKGWIIDLIISFYILTTFYLLLVKLKVDGFMLKTNWNLTISGMGLCQHQLFLL